MSWKSKLGAALVSVCVLAGMVFAQGTTTRELQGTVLAVDGNDLVVKMSDGEVRHIVAPSNLKVKIAGQDVAVPDLKPGTKLKATVSTTTTSVTERTVQSVAGKVWFVAGPNVILTLASGENKQYKVKDDVKFMVDGRPATVFELRKGMKVTAQKITEEPKTLVSSSTVVTGEAPAPVAVAKAATPSAPTPAPVPAPAPKAAPAPAPAAETAAAPATLPKTGSPLPLIGLAGSILTALSLAAMARRRK
jgi:LPXTG-motif cell wall-anchored protein